MCTDGLNTPRFRKSSSRNWLAFAELKVTDQDPRDPKFARRRRGPEEEAAAKKKAAAGTGKREVR